MISSFMDRGIYTINEARDVMNLDPVEGGDVRAVRGEYKNANDINENVDNGNANADNKNLENPQEGENDGGNS